MDLQGILFFLLGLLIRIGIPVGITVLIVMWLYRLDARWQEEAEREVAEVKEPENQIHCWEIKNCSPEKIVNCPAYIHKETPCWQVFRQKNGFLRESCIGCNVLVMAPVPAQ